MAIEELGIARLNQLKNAMKTEQAVDDLAMMKAMSQGRSAMPSPMQEPPMPPSMPPMQPPMQENISGINKLLKTAIPTEDGDSLADKAIESLIKRAGINIKEPEVMPMPSRGLPMEAAPELLAAMQNPMIAAKGGGLMNIAAGGEFSGRVPGDGHGMEDNVYMPIKEGNKQVATLAVSPTEYVVDSFTMAALGNGNPDEGADVMDKVVKDIRKESYGTTEQPNQIDGLQSLKEKMEIV